MLGREGSCRKFYRVSYSRQQGKSTDKPRSDRAQPNAEEELCPSRLFCACVCVCVCVRVCVCVCVCVSVCEHTGHVIIWLSRLLLPPRQQKRPSGGQWRRRCGCARSGAVPYLLLFFFDATGSLCWASRNWKQERDAGLKGARPESTTTTDWHKKKSTSARRCCRRSCFLREKNDDTAPECRFLSPPKSRTISKETTEYNSDIEQLQHGTISSVIFLFKKKLVNDEWT